MLCMFVHAYHITTSSIIGNEMKKHTAVILCIYRES